MQTPTVLGVDAAVGKQVAKHGEPEPRRWPSISRKVFPMMVTCRVRSGKNGCMRATTQRADHFLQARMNQSSDATYEASFADCVKVVTAVLHKPEAAVLQRFVEIGKVSTRPSRGGAREAAPSCTPHWRCHPRVLTVASDKAHVVHIAAAMRLLCDRIPNVDILDALLTLSVPQCARVLCEPRAMQ